MYYNSAHAPSATKLLFTEFGPAAIMDPQAQPWKGPQPPKMPKRLSLSLRCRAAQQDLIETVITGATYCGCHLQRIHLN